MKHKLPERSSESAVTNRVAGYEMCIVVADMGNEEAHLESHRADALAAWLVNEWLRGHSEGGGS